MALRDLIMTDKDRERRRRDRALVEAEALRLYDHLNGNPDKVVRVSKAECLRRAAVALRSNGRIA